MTTNPRKMKVLVFGAGVLGSLYAARMRDADNDVTVVARSTMAARDEMVALNAQLFALAREVGVETPMMTKLHRYSDPAVATVNEEHSRGDEAI